MKPRVSQWDTNYAFIISHHLKKSNGKIKPAVKDKAGLELVIAQYHASDLLIIHHHPVPLDWHLTHAGGYCAGLLVPHNGFPLQVILYPISYEISNKKHNPIDRGK